MEENKSRKQKLKKAWKYWTQPFRLLQHFIALCLAIIALVVKNNLAKNYVINRQARQDAIVSSVISDRQRQLDEAAKLAASTTNIKPIRERFETTKAVAVQKPLLERAQQKERSIILFSENVIIVDPK